MAGLRGEGACAACQEVTGTHCHKSPDAPGQSVRGASLCSSSQSKVPAQASLCVSGVGDRPSSFRAEAGMEECSYCDPSAGPFAS